MMARRKRTKKFMATAVKHPGSLRATAKRMGLIKGDEKLTAEDLAQLKKRGGPKTRRRVGLAKAFRTANRGR